jgi:hypothetical protein
MGTFSHFQKEPKLKTLSTQHIITLHNPNYTIQIT